MKIFGAIEVKGGAANLPTAHEISAKLGGIKLPDGHYFISGVLLGGVDNCVLILTSAQPTELPSHLRVHGVADSQGNVEGCDLKTSRNGEFVGMLGDISADGVVFVADEITSAASATVVAAPVSEPVTVKAAPEPVVTPAVVQPVETVAVEKQSEKPQKLDAKIPQPVEKPSKPAEVSESLKVVQQSLEFVDAPQVDADRPVESEKQVEKVEKVEIKPPEKPKELDAKEVAELTIPGFEVQDGGFPGLYVFTRDERQPFPVETDPVRILEENKDKNTKPAKKPKPAVVVPEQKQEEPVLSGEASEPVPAGRKETISTADIEYF